MGPVELQYGDVVQIDPEHDERFGGCFMLVTEPKPWGAQGFCSTPEHKGVFYYRCRFEHMEYIGQSVWAPPEDEE